MQPRNPPPPPALRHLELEPVQHDDACETWEAMASVAPAQWPLLWAEWTALAAWLVHRLASHPEPLDDGGEWDCWATFQADDQPSQGLTLQSPCPTAPHSRWMTLTVTLTLRPETAALCSELWTPSHGDA